MFCSNTPENVPCVGVHCLQLITVPGRKGGFLLYSFQFFESWLIRTQVVYLLILFRIVFRERTRPIAVAFGFRRSRVTTSPTFTTKKIT